MNWEWKKCLSNEDFLIVRQFLLQVYYFLEFIKPIACGTWQLCYSQGDYYTKETVVLSGKKRSTPTTFSSEYTLYRDKNCSGDVVYHEKVEYSLDSYSVSTGYPCMLEMKL